MKVCGLVCCCVVPGLFGLGFRIWGLAFGVLGVCMGCGLQGSVFEFVYFLEFDWGLLAVVRQVLQGLAHRSC